LIVGLCDKSETIITTTRFATQKIVININNAVWAVLQRRSTTVGKFGIEIRRSGFNAAVVGEASDC